MGRARGFAYRLSSELSTKLLAMGVTIWLTRSLGPEAWGRMQWALALAALVAALADFGLGNLTLRELSRAEAFERPAWLRAAWTLKGAFWALLLVVFGLAMAIGPGDERGLLTAALAYTAVLSASELSGLFFAGIERLDRDFYVSLAGKLAQAGGALVAIALDFGPAGVLLSMALAGLGGWIWGLTQIKLEGKSTAWRKALAKLWSGLWPYGLVPVLALSAGKVDNLLIRHFLGDGNVGVYQAAYKWLEAIGFVPVAFVIAIYPVLSRTAGKKGGEAEALQALSLLAAMAALAVAFLWALASELPWILGASYAGAEPLLRILSISCLATFVNYGLNNLLVIHGRQARVLAGLGLGLGFNLAANFLFLPRFGGAAAAWATVGTEAVVGCAALYCLAGRQSSAVLLPVLGKALAVATAGAWLAFIFKGAGPFRVLALAAAPALSLAMAFGIGLLDRRQVEEAWAGLLKKRV